MHTFKKPSTDAEKTVLSWRETGSFHLMFSALLSHCYPSGCKDTAECTGQSKSHPVSLLLLPPPALCFDMFPGSPCAALSFLLTAKEQKCEVKVNQRMFEEEAPLPFWLNGRKYCHKVTWRSCRWKKTPSHIACLWASRSCLCSSLIRTGKSCLIGVPIWLQWLQSCHLLDKQNSKAAGQRCILIFLA